MVLVYDANGQAQMTVVARPFRGRYHPETVSLQAGVKVAILWRIYSPAIYVGFFLLYCRRKEKSHG